MLDGYTRIIAAEICGARTSCVLTLDRISPLSSTTSILYTVSEVGGHVCRANSPLVVYLFGFVIPAPGSAHLTRRQRVTLVMMLS